MKFTALAILGLTLLAGQALGFGILATGTGSLDVDAYNFHNASRYDFNLDGTPDLPITSNLDFHVQDLAGTILWSVTIDPTDICLSCVSPEGSISVNFVGFFNIEAGHYDAVFNCNYFDNSMYTHTVLVISTLDKTIRHRLVTSRVDVAVDFDGDNLDDLAIQQTYVTVSAIWEIWGANGPSGVSDVPPTHGQQLSVAQNYPNPFNPQTTVRFEIANTSSARVEVHDTAGRLVYQQALGQLPAGSHQFTWRGVDSRGAKVASGGYIFTVVAGSQRETRKIMLLK